MNRSVLSARAQKLIHVVGECYLVTKNGVQEYYSVNHSEGVELKDNQQERRLSLCFLTFSVLALFVRALQHFLKKEWLITAASLIGSILELPGLALGAVWSTLIGVWVIAWSLSWIVMPLSCGIAMTVVTWYTVFLDSCVPGIFPPSPLTPKKFRMQFPETFHMGYIVAVVNGLVVTFLMYVGNQNKSEV